MLLQKWINVVYAVAVWGALFLLLDKERIKELLPIGIISTILLLIANGILAYLGLLQFHAALSVFGTSVFDLLWAFASGILVMHFMPHEWSKRILVIALATIGVDIMTWISLYVGNLTFLKGYNQIYDSINIFIGITLGVWISDLLFKERVYHRVK